MVSSQCSSREGLWHSNSTLYRRRAFHIPHTSHRVFRPSQVALTIVPSKSCAYFTGGFICTRIIHLTEGPARCIIRWEMKVTCSVGTGLVRKIVHVGWCISLIRAEDRVTPPYLLTLRRKQSDVPTVICCRPTRASLIESGDHVVRRSADPRTISAYASENFHLNASNLGSEHPARFAASFAHPTHFVNSSRSPWCAYKAAEDRIFPATIPQLLRTSAMISCSASPSVCAAP